MSEIGELFREMRAESKALKARVGRACPACTVNLPKAHPKILLPRQRCWCGYRDDREWPKEPKEK